jgi:GntR family transcriptional regulator
MAQYQKPYDRDFTYTASYMSQSRLDLALERDSDVPLGTQLAWKLRAAVASGALRPGDRLPGVRELAAEAGVNVNTVRAVYARLAKLSVIVSEHGRGTFVSSTRTGGPQLGELVERAAQDARRHAVDPRELAAMLYARFDAPATAAPPAGEVEIDARRSLRAEIEALEHDLARLEPGFAGARGEGEGQGDARGAGARLVSARELEAIRDGLAERVTARRHELRAARDAAKAPRAVTSANQPAGPWPELLAALPPRLAT